MNAIDPPRKLRIAQVAPLWTTVPPVTYGGIERIVGILVEGLVRRGHDVTLFASADSQTSARLHPVTPKNMLALMDERTACTYEYYATAAIAEALACAEEFDIIHVHIGSQWIPLGHCARAPALFTVHTFLSEDDLWVARRYPDVALAGISRCQVRPLEGTRDVPVIYNGCEFDRFVPSFAPGTYVAFLGRISHDKNPLDAIRIALKIGLPILLAGAPQDAEEQDYFRKEIEPLIDGERVRYIGPVGHEAKNELLKNAAALLFPVQWEEPFGLVMIEAMACGTPVVAHKLGSVPEVIDQGLTGYWSESIDDMAGLVPKAIQLDRTRVREHARARFGCERMVDDYEKLYHSLVPA